MPVNYQNGKIYTIRSHQAEEIYIGSTTQTLAQRLGKHRAGYKQYKKGKSHYITAYDILQYDDHYIELLELCRCTYKVELHRREGQLIREHNNCVNKQVAGITPEHRKERLKQYREANRDKIAQYRETNKDKLKAYNKQYREANREKLREHCKQYRDANKDKAKAYREANKDKLKAHSKQYRDANKDKLNDKKITKITCECGSIVRRDSISRHRKTKKHLRLLRLLNTSQ